MVKQVNAIYTNGFVKKTDYDSKINEIKGEIPSITGLATTAALNDAKNKTPNLSDLVKKKKIMMQKLKTLRMNVLPYLIIINLQIDTWCKDRKQKIS